MPRQPRLEAPGLIYHIIARGIERKAVFRDNEDYRFFLERLGKILIDTGTKCFAFVLMPNHFHFLLKSSNVPVSSVMRRLLTTYAIYFNKKYKRVGHLFQNRYKSIICQEESYLLELIRYIHLNPLRAGIIKTIIELGDYPFSGHSALLGRERYQWYDATQTLYYFGKNKKIATDKYLKFVRDGLSMGRDSRFSGGGLRRSLNFPENYPKERQAFDDRILGDSDFVLTLQALTDKVTGKVNNENIDDVLIKVAKLSGLGTEQILGRGKSSTLSKARAEISYQAVTNLGLSFAETARQLNLNRSTVARLVTKEKESMMKMRAKK